MRLLANLFHQPWREIVFTATYLYNCIPQASNNWKSPYEAFHNYMFDKEKVSSLQKPLLYHIRAYGCKAFVMIKSEKDFQYRRKRRKLDFKTHIDFLVGYKLTTIYKIWMSYKKKMVSVRDIIFDRDEVWNGMPLQHIIKDIKQLDDAIEIIELPQTDKLEDIQLNKDLEESEIICQIDHKLEDLDLDANNTADNIDKLAEDEKWAQNQYFSPDPSILEAFLANSISILVASHDQFEHLMPD